VPSPDPTEPELIRRAQAGDADAVAALYQANAPAIFRYCYFRVAERATAEDLVGDVFVKMLEGLPRYVDRGLPLVAWLFRIAHDRVVDHHRRTARRRTEALDPRLEADGLSPEAEALARAELARVQALMADLNDEQRLVIQLRFIEGYDLETCARILGKNIGAIKAQQHRALRQLGSKLEH
jgi:RNA polymerase sigma-70 factor (ECF subfamily)